MQITLPQLIPQEICLKCDICCRYTEEFSAWSPFVLKEELAGLKYNNLFPDFIESYGMHIEPINAREGCICPLFDLGKHYCIIYANRPFDCRLYPFLISYDADYTRIILTADRQCPFIADPQNSPHILKHAAVLKEILEKEEMAELVYENKGLILPNNENSYFCSALDKVSEKIFSPGYGLKAISLKDRAVFQRFFEFKREKIFSYAFAYIYSWQDIAHILWSIVDDNLLIFWQQGGALFLLLPPVGKKISPQAIDFSKQLLKERKDAGGRHLIIENVLEDDAEALKKTGFKIKKVNNDYVCERRSLVELAGDGFKSQRWAYNYFKKNYKFALREFKARDIAGCLSLYNSWALQRIKKYPDKFYRLLIEDSFFSHRRSMLSFDDLGLRGKVIESDNIIRGYSFGYSLDSECFAVFAEVTDLGFKGLSQFIFREFCRDLQEFDFVDLMDDSGLEHLRRKKLSYRPVRIIPVHSCREI